jgi:hypothetical protein
MGACLQATWLQKLHAFQQGIKLRSQSGTERNVILKTLWGIRLLNRRACRKIIGHESIMGWLYLGHAQRRARELTRRLNLRSLYVHHRLVVMRVEPDLHG